MDSFQAALHRANITRRVHQAAKRHAEVIDQRWAGKDNQRNQAMGIAWCVELPIAMFDLAFAEDDSSDLLLNALSHVRRAEASGLFEAMSLVCLAVLLSMSKAMPGLNSVLAGEFTDRAVTFYSSVDPSPRDVAALLNMTPPEQWFASTLWLHVFSRSREAHQLFASKITAGLDPIDDLKLHAIDSVLMHTIVRVADEVVVKAGLLDDQHIRAPGASTKQEKGSAPRDHEARPKTAYDAICEILVGSSRAYAAKHGIAPTAATSDQQIVSIYERVGQAFREVAQVRNEELPAGYLNTIVFKFYQLNEDPRGRHLFDEHLKYELGLYRSKGLREDYKFDLRLF